MKNTKNRLLTSALLLFILSVIMVFGLTSCGEEKVEQIYITNAHSPRLNYVEGQELDLSGGVLTAVIGENETLIPLTGEGVTVEGYDKNKLGPQTVTVTYKEQTTTFKVSVIARISADGFEKGYFIGDEFKADKGKLRIAKDDATTFTVNMNDERVTLKSFDSSTAGTKKVVLEFKDGDKVYNCEFNVEVYDASKVTITYPTKNSYYSHDSGLDFSGGYLTIKAGENGSIVRYVDITADMVEGFDLSVATPENRDTPIAQKLKITYLNEVFEFDITITYSGVSVIRDLMSILNEVDLSGDSVTLTHVEAIAAVTAITEYYGLSNRNKLLISEDDINTIVRCATAEINRLYLEGLKDIESSIIVQKSDGALKYAYSSQSYDDTVADIVIMKDKKHSINVYGKILRGLKTDFADLVITGEKTVASSVSVIEEEQYEICISALEHIVKLYDLLKDIQPGWTNDSLVAHKESIIKAVDTIAKENFIKNGNSSVYSVLTGWREGDDFFEIIYSYFMYKDEELGGKDYVRNTLLAKLPMPKAISKWYSFYYYSIYISQTLYKGGTNFYLRDTTQFMYYYSKLVDETNLLLSNKDDTLTQDMFKLIKGDVMVENARALMCGFYYHSGILAESEKFAKLWDDYLVIYEMYLNGEFSSENGVTIAEEDYEKFSAVMADLAALSPSEFYGFTSSLNFLYGSSRGNVLVLSKYQDKGYLSVLSQILNIYYKQTLGEEMLPMYEALIEAMENYSLNGVKETAMADFKSSMEKLASLYNPLSETDKQKFKDLLCGAYDKYLGYYNDACSTEEIVLDSETQKLIDNLEDAIRDFVKISDYINEFAALEDENKELKKGTYIMLFATYDKANAIYDRLVELGKDNADILKALYNTTYTIGQRDVTLEYAFHAIGTTYWRYITGIRLTLGSTEDEKISYSVYDLYIYTNLRNYFAIAADLLSAQYYGDYTNLDIDYVITVMTVYHSMDRMAINLLNVFDGLDMHFDALEAFYTNQLSEDANNLALALKLVDASHSYYKYILSGRNDETKAVFLALMEEAIELQKVVAETENYSTYLYVFYDNYVKFYENVLNPDTEDPEDPDNPGIELPDNPDIPDDPNPDIPENPDPEIPDGPGIDIPENPGEGDGEDNEGDET